jgi:hypothetical protein
MEARGKRQVLTIAVVVCVFAAALVAVASAGAPKLGTSIKVGFDPFDVATGDFNGDGRTDLAVANFAASVDPRSKRSITILAGKKGGKFKAVKTLNSAQPDGIEVARVGKGKEEDLVVSALNDLVEVYKGGKGFKFSAPKSTSVPGGPRDLVADDFNHDARTDVAVTRQDNDDVRVLYGTKGGKGFGNPQTFAGASDGSAVIVARLNGDTLPDLITTNSNTGKLTVMLGKKHGGFKVQSYKQPHAISATVADFDQDGHKDVAVASGTAALRSASRGGGFSKPEIALFKGSASGKLKKDRTFKPKGVPKSFGFQVAAARLNGDPDPDLVLGGSTAGGGRAARGGSNKGYLAVLNGEHARSFSSGKKINVTGSPFKFGLISKSKSDELAVPLITSNRPGFVRILAGK